MYRCHKGISCVPNLRFELSVGLTVHVYLFYQDHLTFSNHVNDFVCVCVCVHVCVCVERERE